MATYWENSCSFWSGGLFLIASFPDLCLLVPSYIFGISIMEKNVPSLSIHVVYFLLNEVCSLCRKQISQNYRNTENTVIH